MAGLLKSASGANIHLSAAADTFQLHFQKPDLLSRQANQFYTRHGMSAEQIEIIFAVYSSIGQTISEFKADSHLQPDEVREFGDRVLGGERVGHEGAELHVRAGHRGAQEGGGEVVVETLGPGELACGGVGQKMEREVGFGLWRG